jgi:hypothetical protein
MPPSHLVTPFFLEDECAEALSLRLVLSCEMSTAHRQANVTC